MKFGWGIFASRGSFATEEKFDLVLGSPPYFPLGSGVEGDHPQKVACRFELRGDIRDYCLAAAKHLTMGGFFACVFPTEQLARIETAAREAGLVIVRQTSGGFAGRRRAVDHIVRDVPARIICRRRLEARRGLSRRWLSGRRTDRCIRNTRQ